MLEIEITGVEIIEGGVEVFARAFNENGQIGFGPDGSVDIERFRVLNPETNVDDIDGDIFTVSPADDEVGIPESTYIEREDPEEAILRCVEHTLSVMKNKHGGGNIIAGKVGNTTTTVYPNAGATTAPVDALMRTTGANDPFSTVVARAGSNAYNTETNPALVRVFSTTTTDRYSRIDRCGFGFDTSAVGTDTISSATISFYINSKITGLGDCEVAIVSTNPASESAFVASDFNVANWGSTKFATNATLASITTGQYTDFALNASGIAYIDPDANTIFGVRSEWDRADSFGGTWASNTRSGIDTAFHADNGSNKPKLVIEHAAGGGATDNALAMCNF